MNAAECAAILGRGHAKQLDFETLICGGYSTLGIIATALGFIVPAVLIIWGIVATARAERTARQEAAARQAEQERHSDRRNSRRFGSHDHDDDQGDGTGRTYPVTDGRYDPDLYIARGGYSTYEAMDRWNIEDYDTYKSNIE